MSDFIGLSHSLEVFEAFFDEHSNLDSRFFLFVFYVPFIGAANAVRGKDERKKKEMAASQITAKKKEKRVQRRKLDVDDVHHKSKRPHGPSKWKILLKISR